MQHSASLPAADGPLSLTDLAAPTEWRPDAIIAAFSFCASTCKVADGHFQRFSILFTLIFFAGIPQRAADGAE